MEAGVGGRNEICFWKRGIEKLVGCGNSDYLERYVNRKVNIQESFLILFKASKGDLKT